MLTWIGLGLNEGLTRLSGTLNSYDAGKVVQVPENIEDKKRGPTGCGHACVGTACRTSPELRGA